MSSFKKQTAVTILEMLVVIAIVTAVLGATLRVIANVQFMRERSEDATSLALRANAELEKIKAAPFEEISAGKRQIEDLKGNQTGEISVTELEAGKLKQIDVTMRTSSARNVDEITYSTLIAKPALKKVE
jgi:hypothetical protein